MRANIVGVTTLGAVVLLLGGCTSALRVAPDFSTAVRQDVAAQIADPDAHYTGVPAPGSDGVRVGIAQFRYQKNAVIPPAATSTSSATVGGSGSAGAASSGSSGP